MDGREELLDAIRSLSGKIDGVKADVAGLDKRVEVYAARNELKLEQIEKLDQEQNTILAEHQARSIAIQKDVELRDRSTQATIRELDVRVQKAELPLKIIKSSAQILTYVGGASAGIMTIIHFLSKVK